MERPIFKPVGTPMEQLDTPALVVDLAILEQNIDTLHAFFRQREAKVRPHVESHRCPAIAHKQLAAGGSVGGICVSTVGQAEVFAEHGFTDMLVANEIVGSQKINRLCALVRHASLTVAVDHAAECSGSVPCRQHTRGGVSTWWWISIPVPTAAESSQPSRRWTWPGWCSRRRTSNSLDY